MKKKEIHAKFTTVQSDRNVPREACSVSQDLAIGLFLGCTDRFFPNLGSFHIDSCS